MALKSTIYKAEISLSDMDRNVYGEHALTLALPPPETLPVLPDAPAATSATCDEAGDQRTVG